MGSQSKATPTLANSPWIYDAFYGDQAPRPDLWALDGVYDNVFLASGFFSDQYYWANQLGFTSVGVGTVTNLQITLKGVKTTGICTSFQARIATGLGSYLSWAQFIGGTNSSFSPTASPQDFVVSYNPLPIQAALIKSQMSGSNFMLGVDIHDWNLDDAFYIDNLDFKITYTDAPGSGSGGSTFRYRSSDRGRILMGVR